MTIKITSIIDARTPLGSYQQASIVNMNGTDFYKIIGKNHVYVELTKATSVPNVPASAVLLSDGTYIDPANVFAGMSGEEYGNKLVYRQGQTKGLTHEQALAYSLWFQVYGSTMTDLN